MSTMFNRTLNELAYEIMELYRGNRVISDSLDIRQVKSWIQEYRAFLLKQKMLRPLNVMDHSYRQTLVIQELNVIGSDFQNTTLGDQWMLVTAEDIPNPIENNKGQYAINRIALPDLSKPNLPLYSQEQALYSGNGRFNYEGLYPFLLDGKIYIKSNLAQDVLEDITHLHIVGTFQDPYEAGYTDDLRYPIAESMIREIHELIKKEKFPYVHTPLTDTLANDSDDIVNVSQE